MKKKKRLIDFAKGSPVKQVFRFSLPLLLMNSLYILYYIADLAWLGMLGKEHVAAMSFVYPVLIFASSIAIGIGVAASIMISQYKGTENIELVAETAGQSIILIFFMTVFIGIAGYFGAEKLVRLLGGTEEIIVLADSYFKIVFAFAVFIFGSMVFNYIMISLGDVKTPNIILGIANLFNIILDPFLILGLWIFPEMGIRGAAAATVISRSAASFAGLYALFSKKYHINIKISDLKPDLKKIKKILFIGIPESVSLALDSIFQMILISFAAFLGTAYVAAWGIVSRLLKIFILPGDVVGRGVAVGVGQNLGNSGLRKRLKRMSAHVSEIMLGVFCFLSIIIYFNLHSLAGIFLSGNEAETVSATVAFLKRICLAGPLVGVSKIMLGAVKGSGRTFHALLIKISGELMPKVIIAYFLVRVLNFQNGLWNAYLFASVIFFAATLFYFKYKKWDDPVIGDYKLNQEMLDRRMEKILQQRGDY